MAAIKFVAQKTIATAVFCLLLGAAAIPGEAQPARPRAGYALKEPATPEEIEAAKPNPQAPGFRIPFAPLDQLDPAQRREFENASKTFHTPVGDTAPMMLTPDVKEAMSHVRPALEKSAIPQDLWELTILMVGREWGAQFEWWVHAPQAVIAGIPADAVEAIRLGRTPKFTTPGQEATYRYFAELLRDHKVSNAAYERLRAIIGTRELVEITVLASYYTSVAMNLVAHQVPLRSDVKPPLPDLAKRFPATPKRAQ